MLSHNEVIECWSCPHDVDEHDVRARCLEPTCSCGWEQRRIVTQERRHVTGPGGSLRP